MTGQADAAMPWRVTSFDAPLWSALHALLKLANESMPASARRMELGHTDMALLELLMRGPLSPGELARELKVTPAAVTIAVNRLEARGHLLRTADERDARRVLVHLTPHARSEVAHELEEMFQQINEVVTRVPERDRRAITAFLESINDVLRSHATRE